MHLISDEELNLFQQAIDIEAKSSYINVKGHKSTFANFIKTQLYNIYKKSGKNTKWLAIIEEFDRYSMQSLPERKSLIRTLIKFLKRENQEPQPKIQKDKTQRNLFNTDVTYVKGVGPKVAFKFNKLGIFTAYDLLTYYPKKHINYAARTLINQLKEDENVTVVGIITKVNAFNTKNGLGVVNVTISDESGSLQVGWFYAKAGKYLLERYKSQFPKNAPIIMSGKTKFDNYSKKITIEKPEYQIASADFEENTNLNIARIVPIYPLTENLSIKTLRKAIHNAINEFTNEITDILPQYLQNKYDLLTKQEAISQIHFPDSEEMIEKARKTLVYEEFFIFQLKFALLRKEISENTRSKIIKIQEDGLVMKFIGELPFELTKAQKRAVEEILSDLNSEKPMQRLLQGDVGSGKTVVACIMLLSAIENGYQTALMAPTEILAQQHFYNFTQWLNKYNIRTELFTGSNKSALRKQLQTDLVNGQIHIAIGTHALLQDNIEFSNLGAIVIDEQHRFGVKQRSILKAKGDAPQMLTMTATPIPRTLSLTLHGDLDLSIIDELPQGRKPITTYLLGSAHKRAYKLVDEQIKLGHQAYIVYPLIEESETLSAKAATIEAEKLRTEIFPNYNIGLLHGKLKNEEKEQIMSDFKAGKYNILVSTTVVEVGVDVKNATIMVIENAERFGLSQLHQLRGRVGRSDLQSYCVLMTSTSNPETKERLSIMEETNNGFIIAEKDLEIRGPGEFLGIRQSGLPDFSIADIAKDTKILEVARKDAFDFAENQDINNFLPLKTAIAPKSNINPYLMKID